MPSRNTKRSSSSTKTLSKRVSKGVSRFGRSSGKRFGQLTESIENGFKSIAGGFSSAFGLVFSIIVPKSLLKKLDGAGKSKGSRKLGKQVGELSDQFEKKFTKGASGFVEVFGFLLKILVPRFIRVRSVKIWTAVSKRWTTISKRLGKGIGNLAERYLPKWLLNLIKATSKRLSQFTRNFARFFSAYWTSRNYHSLAWATPAILMAMPLVGAVALTQVYSAGARVVHYRVALDQTLNNEGLTKEEKTTRTNLYLRKLAQLGSQRQEFSQYRTAQELANSGDYEAAYAKMLEISPEDTAGFVLGHTWIAAMIRKGEIPIGDEDEKWSLIKKHAEHAQTKSQEKNLVAEYLLHKARERSGESTSLKDLRDLADSYPELHAELWRKYVASGDTTMAARSAGRFSDYAEGKEDRSAADYAVWSACQQMLGNLVEAKEISKAGLEQFGENPIMQKMVAVVILSEIKKYEPKDPRILTLLREGHEVDPKNREINYMMAARLASPLDAHLIEPMINEMREAGTLSEEVFLEAGDIYSRSGRYDESRRFYVEAMELNPKSGRGLNNVAWMYANQTTPPRLQEALLLVSQAISLEPNGEFYETRGQIYFNMGREHWGDAATDLERALNGQLPESDLRHAHETMAKICRWQGDVERAVAHEEQANKVSEEVAFGQVRTN